MLHADVVVGIIAFVPDSRACGLVSKEWCAAYRRTDHILWKTRPLLRAWHVTAKNAHLFEFTADFYARIGNIEALVAIGYIAYEVVLAAAVTCNPRTLAFVNDNIPTEDVVGCIPRMINHDMSLYGLIASPHVRQNLYVRKPRILRAMATMPNATEVLGRMILEHTGEYIARDNLIALYDVRCKLAPAAVARLETFIGNMAEFISTPTSNCHSDIQKMLDMGVPLVDVFSLEIWYTKDEIKLLAYAMFIRKRAPPDILRSVIKVLRKNETGAHIVKSILAQLG